MTLVSPVFDSGETVAAIMVVDREPLARLQRAIDALAVQQGVDPFDVVVAAPPEQHAGLRDLRPWGAVQRLILAHNVGARRSAGLNAAAKSTTAKVVIRVDARSVVPDDYVRRCLERLRSMPAVGVVGGVQRPETQGSTVQRRGVARGLRNRWLLGNASYRRPGAEGSVDTVYLGAFRRAELLELGGFDETLNANEDFELCARYRSAGRQVWLERDIVVRYEARATLVEVATQYHAFGEAKVAFWRRTGRPPSGRQIVALACAGATGVSLTVVARSPRRAITLVALGVAVLTVADHIADPRERDIRVRAQSIATSVAAAGGWFLGIASGGLRSGDLEHALERDAGPFGSLGVDDDLVDDLATHQ